jgi:hypothetical protein
LLGAAYTRQQNISLFRLKKSQFNLIHIDSDPGLDRMVTPGFIELWM